MFNKLFISVFYSGFFPKAPGTMGSFISMLFAIAILQYLGLDTLILLCIFISIVAFKQVNIYEQTTDTHDSKEIVIDELIGMWIAIIIAHDNLYIIALSFIYFRLFDIFKPSIIGKVDKMPGAFGVIVDDMLAGFFGGISSLMTYHLYLNNQHYFEVFSSISKS
jgi:phosphatidylglycerophosphatase A